MPDSPVARAVIASPNHGERRSDRIDMLVLHYTGMPTAAGALARLRDPIAEVSAHYLVFEDGTVVQLVPEARRAWHAGAGAWKGHHDLNSRSIGIEIAHPGHEGGLPPWPEAQIDAVCALSADIVARYAIAPSCVIAHSDMAPGRKRDPGENFPWQRLAEAGVGCWVQPARITGGRFLARGDTGPPVEALQAMLALYGYDVPITGDYCAKTQSVVEAFQRHFRPEIVDGVADGSTITTLRDLLASLR